MNGKFSNGISKFKTCIADKDENLDDLNKCHSGDKADISSKNITKPDIDPDIESVKLPKIDFCEPLDKPPESEVFNKNNSGIIHNLSGSDREKLRHLIKEILRSRNVHKKRNHEMEKLIADNRKKSEKITQLEQDLAAFKLGCSSKENDIKFLTDAHEIQANSLKKQILEFQKTIITLTKQKLNLEIEIQKLKKENEYLNNLNKSIKTGKRAFYNKYKALKEKLKHYSEVEKSKESKEHYIEDKKKVQSKEQSKEQNEVQNKDQNKDQKKVNKEVGCKKCLMNDGKNVKTIHENTVKSALDDLLKEDSLKENKEEIKQHPKDNKLISDLFFLPSQQKLPDIQLFTDF